MTSLVQYQPALQTANGVQAARSTQLNALTNFSDGLPTLEVAMSPENFPFIDGARQACDVTHGVVKLKNVSWPLAGRLAK